MKSKVITIRVTEEEKNQLDFMAKKTNRSTSDCARELMFNHDKKLNSINMQILKIQEQQKIEIDLLGSIEMCGKRTLKHGILTSESLFQTRWAAGKLVNLILKVLEGSLPKDSSFPNEREKEQFIQKEMDKIQREIEEVK